MSFISKVFIKDGIASDTEIVINQYSGEVEAINDLLATIPDTRGVGTYEVIGNKSTFLFEGIGQNEMWVEYDGVLAKSSSVNLSSKILSGSGIPNATLGYVQDWYINSANGDTYEKTGISTWTYKLNIHGPVGQAGSKIYFGASNPTSGQYLPGDMYVNSTTLDIFSKTNATTWYSTGNIKGEKGLGFGLICDTGIDFDYRGTQDLSFDAKTEAYPTGMGIRLISQEAGSVGSWMDGTIVARYPGENRLDINLTNSSTMSGDSNDWVMVPKF